MGSSFEKICPMFLGFFFAPLVYGDGVQQLGVNDLGGVVVGVDVGYSRSRVTNRQYLLRLPLYGENILLDAFHGVSQRRHNVDMSVNIGYSYFIKNWCVGVFGEVCLGKNNRKFAVIEKYFPTESEISGFARAVKLKCGYFFKDWCTMVYGIGGLKFRNVNIRYKYDDQSTFSVGSRAKLSMPLYTLGVGVERPVFKKISVSAEYEYSWKHSKDVSRLNIKAQPFCFHIKQGFKEHSFKVGVKYHI